MTGCHKRDVVLEDGARGIVHEHGAEGVQPTARSGDRRGEANWAWAKSGAGYDWMDHAPLFEHRD